MVSQTIHVFWVIPALEHVLKYRARSDDLASKLDARRKSYSRHQPDVSLCPPFLREKIPDGV